MTHLNFKIMWLVPDDCFCIGVDEMPKMPRFSLFAKVHILCVSSKQTVKVFDTYWCLAKFK